MQWNSITKTVYADENKTKELFNTRQHWIFVLYLYEYMRPIEMGLWFSITLVTNTYVF